MSDLSTPLAVIVEDKALELERVGRLIDPFAHRRIDESVGRVQKCPMRSPVEGVE